ncbi:MAG: type 2 isopentenyl-diphosphate Delta-isomerase, partial [Saprospiraceae bacterium]|nr:type 2 isopentenyl-diphosphate Delta-isomerase [Saprospiraceae bacterium]
LDLALRSRIARESIDSRFYYEPILSAHPAKKSEKTYPFLNKKLRVPIWVSSMTGGTTMARTINRNLARACGEFGMGMGLGSCRMLLDDDSHIKDFDVRDLIGHDLPLFGNLGIAQLEQLVNDDRLQVIDVLIEKLQLDGMIIHVNPMQEWFQPEGDRLGRSPLESIRIMLETVNYPVIVKEVGQGMGLESLEALFRLPLAAIDFGASGGTNFALLEQLRADDNGLQDLTPLVHVGHDALEMVEMTNLLVHQLGDRMKCHQVIISGGVQNFLDGYFLMHKIQTNAIYGQASAFLRHATGSYEHLQKYIDAQIQGLRMAQTYLKVK